MSITSNIPALSEGTTIGAEIQVSGRIEGQETLRVEGRIDGAISLTETVYVEESGVIVAQVEARDVVVSGIIIGDVTATNSVTLNAGAKLVGNIDAPRLIVADGAAFRGDITMGDAPPIERRKSIAARATVRTEAEAPRRVAPARKAAPPRAAPAKSRPAARKSPPAAAPARAAAAPKAERNDDEITVVVKHAALRRGERAAPAAKAAAPKKASKKKKAAKKGRARVPARGKRRVSRRS